MQNDSSSKSHEQSTPPRSLITCLDFEGVLIPEVWVGLAQKTGIKELLLTTRDIQDYDELMTYRLKICEQHNLGIKDIHEVVDTMSPLDGAGEFLSWLRQRSEVIILSDTFREFVVPLVAKLNHPTLFCHSLVIEDGMIVDYKLRQEDQKQKAVHALKSLNFQITAVGDSYNDLSMLQSADSGIFFCPTVKITEEYPELPVTQNYEELKSYLCDVLGYAKD